ncbi:MAG: SdpI family protein [Propionibacteriaceae bacterium]|nr:SdpI family protein [Propionibacteriaceae bacterium]
MSYIWAALALGVVTAYFLYLYGRAKAGTLPLNGVVGLRTGATMRNAAVWRDTHQRYAAVFFVDAVLFGLGAGTLVTLPGVLKQQAGSLEWISLSIVVIMVLIGATTFIGGVLAHNYAKSIQG